MTLSSINKQKINPFLCFFKLRLAESNVKLLKKSTKIYVNNSVSCIFGEFDMVF